MAVSVPLRGLWFLSIPNEVWQGMKRSIMFPSPYGDYGSYHFEEVDEEDQ